MDDFSFANSWKFLEPISFPFVFSYFLLILMGCQTANKPFTSLDSDSAANRTSLYQPSSDQDYHGIRNSIAANFPLGIGARMDFFLSETSDQVSSVYNSYIKPYRKGKIFHQKPYELDYSILPKKGESFNQTNPLNNVTIRSDYDFRIGMSRRFQHFSDFLKPDFFMAKGRYSPTSEDDTSRESSNIHGLEENSTEQTLPDMPANSDLLLKNLLQEPLGK